MACNYCFPTRTTFQINSEFWKEGIFRWENRTSCLVGLKTHPTIVPRSGIELTTSRLYNFIMAKVSHALNHSARRASYLTENIISCIAKRNTIYSTVCTKIIRCLLSRGGTIHRCIDISRYFSRDTYRDIIFYNHNFCFFQFLFLHNDFHLGRKET